MKKIVLASDHAGFDVKEAVKEYLLSLGVEVIDLGTHSTAAVDYPDFGRPAALMVSRGEVDGGVLACGSGIGMVMVANKFPRVRAGLVFNLYTARMSREHTDCNVIVLPGRVISRFLAVEMVKEWLGATFQGGRHARRKKKLEEIEKETMKM